MKATALSLLLLGLVACGGPKARIKDNQGLYDTYPPEVQAMIKSGQIANGFDRNQVYMALGKPERKESRGAQEVWLYTYGVKRTLKHEKGAVEFENEQLKYEKAVAEYKLAVAEGRYAVEPKKPDPFVYQVQHRTALRREVVFNGTGVEAWRDPNGEYLDEWH